MPRDEARGLRIRRYWQRIKKKKKARIISGSFTSPHHRCVRRFITSLTNFGTYYYCYYFPLLSLSLSRSLIFVIRAPASVVIYTARSGKKRSHHAHCGASLPPRVGSPRAVTFGLYRARTAVLLFPYTLKQYVTRRRRRFSCTVVPRDEGLVMRRVGG